MPNEIILVDSNDKAVGVAEKLETHQKGWLHRAFSVFVLRKNESKWQVLLQQRHPNKYHCGGLWSNTCCSHPFPAESILAAATRRLQQEMGISIPLNVVGKFTYRAEFTNGLIEHEVDHVLVGYIDSDTFNVNPEEVADYAWVDVEALEKDLLVNSERYTPWLGQALVILQEYL